MNSLIEYIKKKGIISNRIPKYFMKKLSMSLAYCVIGAILFTNGTVRAEDDKTFDETVNIADENNLNDESDNSEEMIIDENNINNDTESLSTENVSNDSHDYEEKTEEEIIEEIGDKVDKKETIMPRPVRLSLDDISTWDPSKIENDEINRASIRDVVNRKNSKPVNDYASEEAKILSLSYMVGNKLNTTSSAGSSEFNINSFDKWQYVDDLVFWDGPVPTPDVIDAAHRNGTRIHGTLFFDNFAGNEDSVDYFLNFIKKDENGNYPNATKLAEIAVHYGFDGYFVNQEVRSRKLQGKIPEMKDFLIQLKSDAKKLGRELKIVWYDSWADNGIGHEWLNKVSSENDDLLLPDEDGNLAVDMFFINFNWNGNTEGSVNHMKKIERNPFDAYAGLELQKDVRYRAVGREDLLENGKLRVSIGLFIPDTVNGLANNEDEVDEVINDFYTGENNDPTNIDDSKDFNGMSRYVTERTTILEPKLYTRFSRGNGHSWFKDGEKVSDNDWNNRSIQDILPTWTWWIESSLEEDKELKVGYDYEDAFNGGNSIKLEGNIAKDFKQDLRLFSTDFKPNENTVVKFVYKDNSDADIKLGISTNPDHLKSDFEYREPQIVKRGEWKEGRVDISDLKDKSIYALSLLIHSDKYIEDYKLNLGEFSISSDESRLDSPKNVKLEEKRLKSSKESEAIISFDPVDQAKYYDVYRKTLDGEQWLGSSSSNYIYLPNITRERESLTNIDDLLIYSISPSGVRSESSKLKFDWKVDFDASTEPNNQSKNIAPEAKVHGVEENPTKAKLTNGTIVDLTDKWWEDSYTNIETTIEFDNPRSIKRWVVNNAGLLESGDDGAMNARSYDLRYFDEESGEWKVADEVRDNIYHKTDRTIEESITAKKWQLYVYNADNGTPWKGTRIYGLELYEEEDKFVENIPMSNAEIVHVKGDRFLVKFNEPTSPFDKKFFAPEPKKTVILYKDKEMTEKLAEKEIDENGVVVFDDIRLEDKYGLIYYVTKVEGKNLSNRLFLEYSNPELNIDDTNNNSGSDIETEDEKINDLDGNNEKGTETEDEKISDLDGNNEKGTETEDEKINDLDGNNEKETETEDKDEDVNDDNHEGDSENEASKDIASSKHDINKKDDLKNKKENSNDNKNDKKSENKPVDNNDNPKTGDLGVSHFVSLALISMGSYIASRKIKKNE